MEIATTTNGSAASAPACAAIRGDSADDLRAARTGDAAAIERLLLPHEAMLRSLCRGILGNAADAEDAVQETFFRTLQNLDRFRGDARFSTYLTKIAVHVCVDWNRRRHAEISLENWNGEATTEESLEKATLDRLTALDALHVLPPKRRAVFLLREMEGWNMGEIGAVMGWSAPRVRVELFQARRALAAFFRREEERT